MELSKSSSESTRLDFSIPRTKERKPKRRQLWSFVSRLSPKTLRELKKGEKFSLSLKLFLRDPTFSISRIVCSDAAVASSLPWLLLNSPLFGRSVFDIFFC